jgi:hypothetical protein
MTDVFSFQSWPHTHVVHVTHVNPDGTVTIQDDHGHVWFGVSHKDLRA